MAYRPSAVTEVFAEESKHKALRRGKMAMANISACSSTAVSRLYERLREREKLLVS